jgi:hypothetical protein
LRRVVELSLCKEAATRKSAVSATLKRRSTADEAIPSAEKSEIRFIVGKPYIVKAKTQTRY